MTFTVQPFLTFKSNNNKECLNICECETEYQRQQKQLRTQATKKRKIKDELRERQKKEERISSGVRRGKRVWEIANWVSCKANKVNGRTFLNEFLIYLRKYLHPLSTENKKVIRNSTDREGISCAAQMNLHLKHCNHKFFEQINNYGWHSNVNEIRIWMRSFFCISRWLSLCKILIKNCNENSCFFDNSN